MTRKAIRVSKSTPNVHFLFFSIASAISVQIVPSYESSDYLSSIGNSVYVFEKVWRVKNTTINLKIKKNWKKVLLRNKYKTNVELQTSTHFTNKETKKQKSWFPATVKGLESHAFICGIRAFDSKNELQLV